MDRTTKILLAAIALGVWVNAAATVIEPSLDRYGFWIRGAGLNLNAIALGQCGNPKLC
jgi:hypothetical protein